MNVDLTKPWDLADVIFIIKDKKVFVNKAILMMSSDVFRTMFTADFKEKYLAEIPLPGKNFASFLMLMKVIHPPNMEVNGTNVRQLLPLAHEYGAHHVIASCEKVLLAEPPSVKLLALADLYSLLQLRDACLDYTERTPLTRLETQPGFDELRPNTMIEILRHKVVHTEVAAEPKVELTKEFLCELMSKPPSMESLVLAEKYDIPQLKETCINHAKSKSLSELKTEPGFEKITPVSLVQILRDKIEAQNKKFVNLQPRLRKLERLEEELKSAASILTQVTNLEKGGKQSRTVCKKLPEQKFSTHTAGSQYGRMFHKDCAACKLSIMEDIKNLCIPALQTLNNIK